jgi:hypothetical protein
MGGQHVPQLLAVAVANTLAGALPLHVAMPSLEMISCTCSKLKGQQSAASIWHSVRVQDAMSCVVG